MQKIMDFLFENDIEDIVVSEKKTIKKLEDKYIKNIKLINDARSACFFAFGKAYKDNKTVALIIDGEYLTNIYTAVTEAWFQKAKLLIIAYYDSYKKIKNEYLNRCLIKQEISSIEDLTKEDISNINNINGPVLLNIFGLTVDDEKINYNKILDCVSDCINEQIDVFIYNSKNVPVIRNLNIKNIEEKHKYGIVSKYIGYVLAINKISILCCTSDILLYDMNIFNNRYNKKCIKIIVMDKLDLMNKKLNKWISNNNFNYVTFEKITKENIEKFIFSDETEVMIIREVE